MSENKSCPEGQILRKGFHRKIGKGKNKGKEIYVKPKCIKDRGKKGKGKPIIPIGDMDAKLWDQLSQDVAGKPVENITQLTNMEIEKIADKLIEEKKLEKWGGTGVRGAFGFCQGTSNILENTAPESSKKFKHCADYIAEKYKFGSTR